MRMTVYMGMRIFTQSPQATPFDTLLGYRVNLGGWFVLEPFISPALFQKYPGTVDEWTLSTQMAADTSPGGGLSQIETHYQTFIVSQLLPLLRQLLIVDFYSRPRKILLRLQVRASTGSGSLFRSGPSIHGEMNPSSPRHRGS